MLGSKYGSTDPLAMLITCGRFLLRMRNLGLDDDDGRRLCQEWFCILAGHGVRWPEIGVDAALTCLPKHTSMMPNHFSIRDVVSEQPNNDPIRRLS